MAQEDCVTHRKCCIRLHLVLFSLSPREKKPCKSGQLSGPISLFLFPELPGLPAADSAPLGFLLLVGLHPSFLRSRSLAVTAGNVLTISPGRSEVTVPSWHIRLLPRLFTMRLLSCGKPEPKVSWCLLVPSHPGCKQFSVSQGLFPPVSFVHSDEEGKELQKNTRSFLHYGGAECQK